MSTESDSLTESQEAYAIIISCPHSSSKIIYDNNDFPKEKLNYLDHEEREKVIEHLEKLGMNLGGIFNNQISTNQLPININEELRDLLPLSGSKEKKETRPKEYQSTLSEITCSLEELEGSKDMNFQIVYSMPTDYQSMVLIALASKDPSDKLGTLSWIAQCAANKIDAITGPDTMGINDKEIQKVLYNYKHANIRYLLEISKDNTERKWVNPGLKGQDVAPASLIIKSQTLPWDNYNSIINTLEKEKESKKAIKSIKHHINFISDEYNSLTLQIEDLKKGEIWKNYSTNDKIEKLLEEKKENEKIKELKEEYHKTPLQKKVNFDISSIPEQIRKDITRIFEDAIIENGKEELIIPSKIPPSTNELIINTLSDEIKRYNNTFKNISDKRKIIKSSLNDAKKLHDFNLDISRIDIKQELDDIISKEIKRNSEIEKREEIINTLNNYKKDLEEKSEIKIEPTKIIAKDDRTSLNNIISLIVNKDDEISREYDLINEDKNNINNFNKAYKIGKNNNKPVLLPPSLPKETRKKISKTLDDELKDFLPENKLESLLQEYNKKKNKIIVEPLNEPERITTFNADESGLINSKRPELVRYIKELFEDTINNIDQTNKNLEKGVFTSIKYLPSTTSNIINNYLRHVLKDKSKKLINLCNMGGKLIKTSKIQELPYDFIILPTESKGILSKKIREEREKNKKEYKSKLEEIERKWNNGDEIIIAEYPEEIQNSIIEGLIKGTNINKGLGENYRLKLEESKTNENIKIIHSVATLDDRLINEVNKILINEKRRYNNFLNLGIKEYEKPDKLKKLLNYEINEKKTSNDLAEIFNDELIKILDNSINIDSLNLKTSAEEYSKNPEQLSNPDNNNDKEKIFKAFQEVSLNNKLSGMIGEEFVKIINNSREIKSLKLKKPAEEYLKNPETLSEPENHEDAEELFKAIEGLYERIINIDCKIGFDTKNRKQIIGKRTLKDFVESSLKENDFRITTLNEALARLDLGMDFHTAMIFSDLGKNLKLNPNIEKIVFRTMGNYEKGIKPEFYFYAESRARSDEPEERTGFFLNKSTVRDIGGSFLSKEKILKDIEQGEIIVSESKSIIKENNNYLLFDKNTGIKNKILFTESMAYEYEGNYALRNTEDYKLIRDKEGKTFSEKEIKEALDNNQQIIINDNKKIIKKEDKIILIADHNNEKEVHFNSLAYLNKENILISDPENKMPNNFILDQLEYFGKIPDIVNDGLLKEIKTLKNPVSIKLRNSVGGIYLPKELAKAFKIPENINLSSVKGWDKKIKDILLKTSDPDEIIKQLDLENILIKEK